MVGGDPGPAVVDTAVSQPWFGALRDRVKTVEGRLDKGKFAGIRVGHALVISNADAPRTKKLVAVVTRVARYPDFRTYMLQEGLARTLPGTQTIDEGVAVYRKFYSAELERAHGVVAIHVHVLS